MKKCPFCAKEIQEEAIKCRYCGGVISPQKVTRLILKGVLNKEQKSLISLVLVLLGIDLFLNAAFPSILAQRYYGTDITIEKIIYIIEILIVGFKVAFTYGKSNKDADNTNKKN